MAEVHEQDRYPIVWPADPALWLSPADLLMAWIAVRPQGVVGHIALVGNGDTPDGLDPSGQPLALISRLFVTPSARRQAVGAQLLEHAQTLATQAGLALMLEVAELSGRAAIALYERAGWRHASSATTSWTTPAGEPVAVRYYRPPT